MRKRTLGVALCALLVAAGASGCGKDETTPLDGGPAAGPEGPRLPARLLSRCYDWPIDPFSMTNIAPTEIRLSAGDRAVDFELADLDGQAHVLSSLLAEKPVLLVTGSYT